MQILKTQTELRDHHHTDPALFLCSACGQSKPVQSEGGTGYGYDEQDKPVCYACCAVRDNRRMIETGRATLYLCRNENGTQHGNFALDNQPTKPLWTVSNWPGTLKFSAYVKSGRHNIARTRYDAWFTGPDGRQWHGVNYGENSQICHCRRLKG